jgi:hypothetical protein
VARGDCKAGHSNPNISQQGDPATGVYSQPQASVSSAMLIGERLWEPMPQFEKNSINQGVVAVGAVCCEPLSRPNSLIGGYLQGKMRNRVG